MQFDDEPDYHAAACLVYVGSSYAFELAAIWNGIQSAEDAGITLAQIGVALAHNWPATVVALALKNIATLRVLITEVTP